MNTNQPVGRTDGTVDLADFGLVPHSGLDATEAVAQALAHGQRTGATLYRFPPGRYDFHGEVAHRRSWPLSNTDVLETRRAGIVLEDLGDIVLDGQGAELVFHGAMTAIAYDRVSRVTLRNFVLDWEPPFNADAEVLSAGATHIELRIDPVKHPFHVRRGALRFQTDDGDQVWRGDCMEFERDTRRVPQGSGDRVLGWGRHFCWARRTAEDRVVLHGWFSLLPRVGNVLVLRHGSRSHAGIYLQESRHITVEDVEMRNNSGLGILSQYCEGVTLRRMSHRPGPGRYLAGHDDGAQFSSCRGKVLLEGCHFAGLQDDAINIHGTAVRVLNARGRTIVARFEHPQSQGMVWARPGDKLAILSRRTLESLGQVTVRGFHARDSRVFELELDQDFPRAIARGQPLALENLTWAPDVEIRDCDLRHGRARGILVSTPGRVLIEDNRFETSGCAILVAGDANQWWESGAVRDLTIRRNHFTEHCLTSDYQFCEAVVSIRPSIPRLGVPYHRNISVTDNHFHCHDAAAFFALSVEGLLFARNRIERSYAYPPRHADRPTLAFDSCRQVRVADNQWGPDLLGLPLGLRRMKGTECLSDLGPLPPRRNPR